MLLLALVIAAATPDLGWLAGSWTADDGPRWTQETWSAPRAGVMLGTGLSGDSEVAKSFEFMRIAPDAEGKLVFWGSPEGKPPVAFRWQGGGAGQAVFVNQAHDYPQRIAYRREGAALIATISLADGSKARSWRYVRAK